MTGSAPLVGLSREEAARRLAAEGPNELPSSQSRSALRVAADLVRQPMLLLLLGTGSLYFLLGEVREGLMLLTFVVVVIGITFYQENKTEHALEALRDLSSPRALVVREGQQVRIAGREVVRGDLVLLSEGDRVPADGLVIDAAHLSVDESLLTGESVPVRKRVRDAETALGRPGGDGTPFAFSGTLVVKGRGVVEVLATGTSSEMGRIGKALATLQPEPTPLQAEIGRLVRRIAVIGLCVCVAVVLVFGFTRGDWIHGVLAGAALAMAMLPEEFPVVLTIFLALGTWRLSKRQVLIRRLPAVETIGAATVLAVDKTGTLTLNQMTVRELWAAAGDAVVTVREDEALPEEVHALVEYGVLGSAPHGVDPMDAAFHALGRSHLAGTEHLHSDWQLVREYPLTDKLLAIAQVWRSPDGADSVVAAKGAPEAIIDLCHLSDADAAAVRAALEPMTGRGLRVLGVARAMFRASDALPPGSHDFDFAFVGLAGLVDPVRSTVPAAIADCRAAGIRVVMITGDYPGTALSIAREAGLVTPDEVGGGTLMTGAELDACSDEELAARIGAVRVFARVVPEQKLRLVRALQAGRQIVAMTGDGVNDAPALKAAHIGVAMGARGTDVAREAADIVITDDDFSSIVGAVRGGRGIFDNLRKAMAYIFSVHLPILGMSLVPVLLGQPLVLLPVNIAFLELVIDPACSVVFEAEPEEADVMRRAPRSVAAPLFGARAMVLSALQGLTALAGVLAVYGWAMAQGLEEHEVRTLAFTAILFTNLGLIAVNRSWSHRGARGRNPAFWVISLVAPAVLAVVLAVPPLRVLFELAPVAPLELAGAAAAGALSVAWFELYKRFRDPAPASAAPR